MKNNRRFVVLLVAAITACSSSEEGGFKSSDPQRMKELQSSLAKAGIPFHVDAKGFIIFDKKHSQLVERIDEELQQKTSTSVSTKYEEAETTEYLKSVLTAMGIPYTVESKPDGQWVRWSPSNEAQEQEVQNRVSQHVFRSQHCGKEAVTSPSAPAESGVSC